jgi:hypothetical protein
MSEIKKYQKAMNFKANPRYLTRDFIVPLYTGTEPDILDDSNTQRETGSYTPFPNDMPVVSPKEIQNQPYEQLELADGGRANFSEGSKLTGTDKTLEQNIKEDHKAFNDYRKSIGSPTIPLDNEYIRMWIRTRLNEGGSVERQGFAKGSVPPGYITGKQLEELTGIPNLSVQAKELMYAPKKYKRAKNLFGDFYRKELKAKYFDIGQGGKYGTLHYKTPTAEQIKTMKEYHSRKGSKYGVSPNTVDRMKLFHNDPKLRNYVRNGKIIPDELLKDYDITRNEAAQTTFRLAQTYNGKKFTNVDVGIPENKKAGKKLFEAIDRSPFGNPYKMASYKEALNVITEGIGNKYFENTTFEDMKREARRILQKEKIAVFDPTVKGSKGININELTGVTSSSRNKSYPYSQFINLMEGNLNTKNYAGFNKQFEKYEKDLQKEIGKGSKGNPNEVIKKYRKYSNNFIEGLDDLNKAQIEKLGLPELSLKQPTELYGKKRTAQLLEQGLDLPGSYKELGYSIKVPKGTSTLKEFINNPEIRTQMIANIGCPTIGKSLGGRVNFSEGSNCYAKGLEKIKSGELNMTERTIAGDFLKEAGAGDEIVNGILKGGKKSVGVLEDFLGFGKGVVGRTITPLVAANSALEQLTTGNYREAYRQAFDFLDPLPLIGVSKLEKARQEGSIENVRSRIGKENQESFNRLLEVRDVFDKLEDVNTKLERVKSATQDPNAAPESYDPDYINDLKKQQKDLNKIINTSKYQNIRDDFLNVGNALRKETYSRNINKPIQEKTVYDTANLETLNRIFGSNFLNQFEDENKIISPNLTAADVIRTKEENMPPMSDEQRTIIEEMGARGGAADGGRIGLKEGGGPKMGRRGFLGLLAAGAAATPEIIKGLKGEKKAVQVAKLASKIKLEKPEGMYPWFPDLVEKIKTKGKPFEEKDLIMEASYKHEAKGYGGLPTGEETITRHVDGDTEFLLREYPDGRIAVDIHSPRNQESFETPVTLYYRPTMELQYQSGVKVEPAEFKVLEKEPRYFANGPDDVDIELSETRKVPGKNTIYGDVEAAERFATGKIENRKIIPAKQARRDQMLDQPTDFIEETAPYGPVYD